MESPNNRSGQAQGGVYAYTHQPRWVARVPAHVKHVAVGLEEAFETREHLLLELGIARLGYGDDLRLYGKVSALSRRWSMVIGALASAGRAVQPAKSKFLSPTADIRQSLFHPVRSAVEKLASHDKRNIGGLDLLGGAAATELDVSTFVTTAATTITIHAEKRIDKSGFYAARLRQFQVAQTTPQYSRKWLVIATKSMAKDFSHDAALIPRGVPAPAVKPVVGKIAAIFQLCAGDLSGDTDAAARIGIAPTFSGRGARVEGIELQADAAYFSTWASSSKRMGSVFDSKRWHRRAMAGQDGAVSAQLRLLAAWGIVD